MVVLYKSKKLERLISRGYASIRFTKQRLTNSLHKYVRIYHLFYVVTLYKPVLCMYKNTKLVVGYVCEQFGSIINLGECIKRYLITGTLF